MNQEILKEDIRNFADQFDIGEQLRGNTFLITGATGLIGSVMVKCLLGLNRLKGLDIKIKAVVRDIDKAKNVFAEVFNDIEFFSVELSNISYEIVGNVDYIVHLASPTASKFFVEHPVETLTTAISGTKAVLEYAKGTKVKSMVYASSLEVYGSNLTDEWINEDFQGYVNPTEVRSSYNIGKRACECLCHAYAKEYDVSVSMARLTQTFGAGVSEEDNRVFAQFARCVLGGNDIVLHTHGYSSKPYIYTADAVSAIIYMLLFGKKGEAYNVANKESYISIRDMALLVASMSNPLVKVVFNLNDNLGYAPETKLRLDTAKIEQLGWKPRYGLKEMFERLIESMK